MASSMDAMVSGKALSTATAWASVSTTTRAPKMRSTLAVWTGSAYFSTKTRCAGEAAGALAGAGAGSGTGCETGAFGACANNGATRTDAAHLEIQFMSLFILVQETGLKSVLGWCLLLKLGSALMHTEVNDGGGVENPQMLEREDSSTRTKPGRLKPAAA